MPCSNTVFGGDKMKLEVCDDIHLKEEIEELAECGIHKGCFGTVMQVGEPRSLVIFYNRQDIGNYAFAWVENCNLEFYRKQLYEETALEMMEWFKTQDPTKKTRFSETHLREYDAVRVLVEKEEYAKRGVHKGMVGTILEPEKIDGRWDVYFEDEEFADTIESPILETDLELVFRPGEQK